MSVTKKAMENYEELFKNIEFSKEDEELKEIVLNFALDEHHKSPMMKEIAKLRDKYHLRMRVEQFVEKEN